MKYTSWSRLYIDSYFLTSLFLKINDSCKIICGPLSQKTSTIFVEAILDSKSEFLCFKSILPFCSNSTASLAELVSWFSSWEYFFISLSISEDPSGISILEKFDKIFFFRHFSNFSSLIMAPSSSKYFQYLANLRMGKCHKNPNFPFWVRPVVLYLIRSKVMYKITGHRTKKHTKIPALMLDEYRIEEYSVLEMN